MSAFSQGAAAAFGASALQPSYAPDLGIRGAVVTGLPYLTPETAGHLRQDAQRPGDYTLFYTFYIGLLAQQADPGLKGLDMFSARALPLFERSRTACIWQMVLEVLGSGLSRADALKPGYMKALMANLPLLEYPTLYLPQPIFVGIGEEDRDTPAGLQRELVKEACAAGTTVEAHLYAGTRHDNALTRLLQDSIHFGQKVMAGEAITPICQPQAE